MKLKRLTAGFLGLLLIGTLMTGCKSNNKNVTEKKINVVCTIFPEYDWVRNIVGESSKNISVKLLLDNGTDLHSYQPTVDDMVSISDADVFIYVGGESDKWVADALKDAKNKNMKTVNLLDTLGSSVKEEEKTEGMQEEDDEKSEDGIEYDEHVWLSVRNAKVFCKKIAAELSAADSENAATYERNADKYIEELDNLDEEYQQAVNNSKQKILLFGDRFPFRYLTDDYGIKYYAAFPGCSAETEASFETVAFLAKKVDESELPSVITIEGAKHKIAETIIKNTKNKNQTVLTLDSMQSVTSKEIENGETYLKIMTENLEVIKKALQ